MRNIKFRALIKGQHFKGFVYGYYVYSNNSDTHQIIDEHGQIHYIDPETLGQYIGRRDKNGVEVYEGDIVNIQTQDYTPETLSVVQFISNGFDLDRTMIGTSHGGHNLRLLRNYITVVGNIYQNPELLK